MLRHQHRRRRLLSLHRRLSSSSNTTTTTQSEPQIAKSMAKLINSQPYPWPPSFAASSLLSSLSPSSLLHLLPLLSRPLPLLSLAADSGFPLDPRHSSMALHLLLRRRSPSALSSALNFLLSLKSSPHLLRDDLFNALIRALSSAARLPDAVRVFRLMPQFNVAPTVFTFNSLLSAILRRGQTQNAHHLFDEMVRSGVRPDACTFNTLIHGFCSSGFVDEGFTFFRQMPAYECRPDVMTYNALLDGLCRAGRLEVARNFLNGMKRKKGGDGVVPNVVTYTTLVRGYCASGRAVKAVEVLEEMVEAGLEPNKITYNTIVKGLCEEKRMDLVKGVLERDGHGFKPDTCTFNTLIAAHCVFGNVDEAMKVFDKMTVLRVKSDSASYSMLIRGLCNSGDFERAEKLVDELLERRVLSRRGVCVPLIGAYNPIFEYFCKNGKAKKAATLLEQLVERRATMDIVAFKTVISGFCREGEFREGYELMALMIRRNLKLDLEIFENLIEGFLGKENAIFAWKALERMLNCGHRPSTRMFHSVLAALLKKDGLAAEAGKLVEVMVERKVRHNIELLTDVVAGLFDLGLYDRAIEIVGLIYDNGYCVKMEGLVESRCKGKKYLEAKDLLMFSLKKDENLRGGVYARVIHGLCATGRALDAFELFYGLSEKGDASDLSSCLNPLRVALEAAGRSREAKFVSRKMNQLHVQEL